MIGKLFFVSILNVDGLQCSLMLLPIVDHTNTAIVTPSSQYDHIGNMELDEVNNVVGL